VTEIQRNYRTKQCRLLEASPIIMLADKAR